MERDIIFGKLELGTYMYCMHCERVYKYGNFRKIKKGRETYEMCPFDGCDGDAVIDAIEWKSVKGHHPEYPEIPEEGKNYPLN